MKSKTAIRQLIEELIELANDSNLSDRYRAGISTAINRASTYEPVNEQQIIDVLTKQSVYTGEAARQQAENTFNDNFEKP